MTRSSIVALALLCAACSSAPQVTVQPPIVIAPTAATTPAPTSDPLSKLAVFTLADLQAADADAAAQTPPDVTAKQCYDYLLKIIPTIQVPNGATPIGAILGFQKLRDLQNGVTSSSGALSSLNLACAPLVISTQTTINQLAAIAAGTAATAGVAGPALMALPLP